MCCHTLCCSIFCFLFVSCFVKDSTLTFRSLDVYIAPLGVVARQLSLQRDGKGS